MYHHVVVSGALLVMAGGALHRSAVGRRHRSAGGRRHRSERVTDENFSRLSLYAAPLAGWEANPMEC